MLPEMKKGTQKRGHFIFFLRGKAVTCQKRLTLNSAWVFRKHHSELLIQSWVVNQEASSRLGEAGTGTASVTDGAQGKRGLNVACLMLEKQELETER